MRTLHHAMHVWCIKRGRDNAARCKRETATRLCILPRHAAFPVYMLAPWRDAWRCSATSRLAKYDDWYSAAHGWLMLEAQGRGIEAQNQKRLALVSSPRGLVVVWTPWP